MLFLRQLSMPRLSPLLYLLAPRRRSARFSQLRQARTCVDVACRYHHAAFVTPIRLIFDANAIDMFDVLRAI